MSRPEHFAPPEIFYNDTEATKYSNNSRIQEIQATMTERCIELLNLPPSVMDPNMPRPSYLLDIGCGSGLSGELLSDDGHIWAGVDVSASMLEVALERESDGDLFLQDIGQGFGFRPGSIDGAISVSVLQWLCNADSKFNNPAQRCARFFNTLFATLTRGARAAFQFYPESDDQVRFLMQYATKAGFTGGLVVDYPNSKKAKKFYLVLMSGSSDEGGKASTRLPAAKGVDGEEEDESQVRYEKARERRSASARGKGKRKSVKDGGKEWILKKKEARRQKGKDNVPRDSKFTGRKRRVAF